MSVAAALALAEGVKQIGNTYQAYKQQKFAEKTPQLSDNQAWGDYANMIRSHATTGPLTGSQQANMRRELFSQYNPQFNMASQNIMQRATGQGLEDSAVVSEQLTGVDLQRSRTMADIARRIAMRNEELRLRAVDQVGRIGQAEYGSALNRFRNRLGTAGGTATALGEMAGDVGQGLVDSYIGVPGAAPWLDKLVKKPGGGGGGGAQF